MKNGDNRDTFHLNIDEYRDKVQGCWMGKNIGGTLGAPFEGQRETNAVDFYSQDLQGEPEPNDDLDLQLIWLLAAEEQGIYRLNERVLGEYWLSHITGPWNEYGVSKANMRNGLLPPLSGSVNNERWKYSNGAWIRSEIWACIFPGNPDEACTFARHDSCVDHCEEGIFAELFTASLESAAFLVDDVRELIRIGLAHIPQECRIARSVRLACAQYDAGADFLTAREALVKDSVDLGWFQAPANIGFVIIGLLYGEGDFGRSVCIANNCGDDTDCTAGTVGAVMGIMHGRRAIPGKWTRPIGESIRTCSIDTYGRNNKLPIPATLDELTARTLQIARRARMENGRLADIGAAPTQITPDYIDRLSRTSEQVRRIWTRSPFQLDFDLPFARFSVEYENGPEVLPGEAKRLTLRMDRVRFIEKLVTVAADLPEGWNASNGKERIFTVKHTGMAVVDFSLEIGDFAGAYFYLPMHIRLEDRLYPVTVNIPFQRRGSVVHDPTEPCRDFFDASERLRRAAERA